jgi:hypothetical protein
VPSPCKIWPRLITWLPRARAFATVADALAMAAD